MGSEVLTPTAPRWGPPTVVLLAGCTGNPVVRVIGRTLHNGNEAKLTKKWFTNDRVETKVEIACQSPAKHEGTGQRISSGTVELTNKGKEFNKAKIAWGGVGIASYNVETLGKNRIQTICKAMEEKGVKIMLIQYNWVEEEEEHGKTNRRRKNG